MLKGRWLKSCVALVVFFFSLVVACISPVWANTYGSPDYDDAHGITLYVWKVNTDPLRLGRAFTLPVFDRQGVDALDAGYSGPFGYSFQSLQFQPFSYDVSLVLGFTVTPANGGTVSANLDYSRYSIRATKEYFRGGISSSSFSVAGTFVNGGVLWTSDGNFADYGVMSYVLPAGTNGVYFNNTPWTALSVRNQAALFSCDVGYVVHSSDYSVVEQINSILLELKQVNGNLTSGLNTLNQILSLCRDIKADTASIVSLLNVCKEQLVTLNGKVDNIYKLLKDSLVTESASIDKKSEELAGQIMQRVDSEQYWSDKNTETFNSLDMDKFTFGDGVVGALPTVGNLFKSLWDSFGESTLIFTFPLMLGIALVIVGRISRTSGKGGKNGGDSG